MRKDEQLEFEQLIKDLATNPKTKRMKRYIQHGTVTTYEHCMAVAKMSFILSRSLPGEVSEEKLLTGAFLHDYFLYDWHDRGDHLHGYHHPDIAWKNATRDFDLNEKEQNIIRSHMWPMNILTVPKSREARIVCVADKIVSTKETLFKRKIIGE